jgi:hypothetical protein
MPRIVEVSFNLGLWVVMIFAVFSYFFLTRLLKIEHDDFYEQWKKDGKPHGMPFWIPLKELGELGFRSYPWYKGTLWLFKTPDWVNQHQVAPQMFRYFRLTSYIAYFVLFVMFVILFASMPK